MRGVDAVVVVIEGSDGRIVGVSRPGQPDDVGLPGGSIEAGESPEAAAVREVREETGLEVTVQLFSSHAYHQHQLHVFFAVSSCGVMRSSEEGETSWTDWATVGRGHYGEFNRELGERWASSRR